MPCKPYPKQHRIKRALCYVCSTESLRWQRALWRHKAKIDDCSRQNPAYSPGCLTFLVRKVSKRTFDTRLHLYVKSSVRCPSGIPFDRHKSKRSNSVIISYILEKSKQKNFRYETASLCKIKRKMPEWIPFDRYKSKQSNSAISINPKWRKVSLHGEGRRVSARSGGMPLEFV